MVSATFATIIIIVVTFGAVGCIWFLVVPNIVNSQNSSTVSNNSNSSSHSVSFPIDFIRRSCPQNILFENATCYNLNRDFADNDNFFFAITQIENGKWNFTQYRVSSFVWNKTQIEEMANQ